MRILTDATGAVIWKQNGLNLVGAKSLPVSLASAIAAAQAAGVSGDPETWLSWTTEDAALARAIEAAPIERLDATLGGGAITAVEVVAQPEIFAHLVLSGGGMGNTQYAVAQGSALGAALKITATDDPEAAALTGITASWPIVIRDAVTGKIYNKLLAVTEGQGVAGWTPPDNSDYEVRESDFTAVALGGDSYKVRLRSYYETGGALVKIADGSAPIYAYEA